MRNPYLCIVIVLMLGMGGLLCGLGIIVLPLYGKPVPDSLQVLAGSTFGALAAFLVAPPRGSFGGGGQMPPPSMDDRIRAGV